MRTLTARSLLTLLGLAVSMLLAYRTAAHMPEILVPSTQSIPQIPGNDNFTYSYSVWGEPKQTERWSATTPAYEYQSVTVCPWTAVSDPVLYRPEGRTPVAEARAANFFEPHAAK